MNRHLRRLSVIVLAMFMSLFVSTTVVQFAQAQNLADDPRNARSQLDAYRVQRGPILVAGSAIAESVPTSGSYRYQRRYPEGPVYAAVTGYDPLFGQPTGLEAALDGYLAGSSSNQFFDRLEQLVTGQTPRGASVNTTLDPTAQHAAYDALGGQRGAVIVLEPATGKILALVSKPSFDPNLLAVHDGDAIQAAFSALQNDPHSPLDNRAIAGNTNPPGSVFKLVVVAAALESGKYTPESEFPNPARYTLPGTTMQIKNTEGGSCGGGATVSIATALRLSCNVPMAELGVELGAAAIRAQAEKFGFNTSFTIPLHSAESRYPRVLDDAQTALTAFGQYDVRATPLQIALVSAAIANGGRLMAPTLVDSINGSNLAPISQFSAREWGRPISAATAATLSQMMINGVNNGAASNAKIEGIAVAGKTGTAENGSGDPYTLWFTGFAPADQPRYAITVLVENGGGLGQSGYGNKVAAPIARKVLEAVLRK